MEEKTVEEAYWEEWYKGKGARRNCIGSVGMHRRWKWLMIDMYLDDINHVIDVGCGSLIFWARSDTPRRCCGKTTMIVCEDYTGIDISETILEKNKKNYPNLQFIHKDASQRIEGLHKPIVFCLDLLFHIMDDDRFVEILENLCYYSTNWIFIFTWIHPKKKGWVTDGVRLYYRPFEPYYHIFEEAGFELQDIHQSPYDKRGAMIIFKKVK